MTDDYRLEIGQITMQTEGGGIVHHQDEAFATERVLYYAQVQNNTDQYLGPIEIDFTVDNNNIAYGGMSHQGIPPHDSVWVHGYTDHLTVGSHSLHLTARPGDTLFEGAEQSLDITVLQPASRRAMDEGAEVGHSGWAQRQVYVIVRDYAGEGFNSEAYLTFSGPGGDASERGQIVDGNLTLDSVWVPHDGNVVIHVNTPQAAHPTIKGATGFKADGESVRLNFIQGKTVHSESWADMEQFVDKVGVKGSAGVDFKIWKAGVEVSGEHSWGESHTHAEQYEVWVPTGELDDLDKASTRSR